MARQLRIPSFLLALLAAAFVVACAGGSEAAQDSTNDGSNVGSGVDGPLPVEPDGGIGDTPGDNPIPVEPDGGIGDTPASFSALAPPPGDRYAIRATCRVQPCSLDSFRIQLDWNQDSMIGCYFGVGAVSVERWEVGTSQWHRLARAEAPIRAGQPFELAVEVGQEVRHLVDGNEYVKWDRGDRSFRYPRTLYFAGGPVRGYVVYDGWLY